MNGERAATRRMWVLWGLLAAAVAVGLIRYPHRVSLPCDTVQTPAGLLIESAPEGFPLPRGWSFEEGSIYLVALNGLPVSRIWHVRMLLAGAAQGDRVDAELMRGIESPEPDPYRASISIVRESRGPAGLARLGALALVSLVLLALAAFLFGRSDQKAARSLGLTLALLAASLALDEPGARIFAGVGRWMPGMVWAVTYALSGSAMVSFISIYPYRSRFWQRFSWIPGTAWIVGGIVAVVMASGVILTATGNPASGFKFSLIAQYAIWPFIAGCTLLVAIGLASAYRGTDDRAMRNRVRWLLVGVVAGAGPTILLVLLARMLIGDELIPEPLALLFILILPICLVISVVRHRLLDIDVVIHKGLMYGPATLIVAVMFGGGTILATYMILDPLVPGGLSLTFRTALTLLIPLLFFHLFFETLRKRVQRLVDRIFFRTRYSYGETLRAFSEGIEGVVGGAEVLAFLAASVWDVLGPAWLKAVDLDGEWRSYWPALEDGVEPSGPIPVLRIPFPEMEGLELWLGPKRSDMLYQDYDQALIEALTRLASVSLRREVLQRRLLDEESERERLAALTRLKDSFLSLVSHDLRGPLAAISLSAATIARANGESENSQEREAARRIQRNAQRLAGMAERLLHTALADTDLLKASMRECELCRLVDEILERFEELARNGDVRLSSQILPGTSVSADSDLLAEAISNLVDNAIRFTPAGREVSVSLISEGRESRILVSDQGPGIPPERRAGLFRREEQQQGGREAHRGFGIGLYLVSQMMELQGGGVELVQSGEDGSVFALHLPE